MLTIDVPGGPVEDALLALHAADRMRGSREASGGGLEWDLLVTETVAGYSLRSRIDPSDQTFASLADLLDAIEFGVSHFLLLGHPGETHLHAAGATVGSHGGRALLALGPNGAGKSSLALSWSSAGCPLLGDDIVLLREDGGLLPFQRPLKVSMDRLREVGVRPQDTLWVDTETDEGRYAPEAETGWAEAGARAVLVARARWVRDAPLTIRPLPSREALRLLMDSALDTGRTPLASFPAFTALLSEAAAVDVRFGEARAAAEALLRLGS